MSQDTMTAADEKGWHKDDISYILRLMTAYQELRVLNTLYLMGKGKLYQDRLLSLTQAGRKDNHSGSRAV
ncbi:MAG: hypothetical protein ACLRI8_03255 [Agathobacter rectalis]